MNSKALSLVFAPALVALVGCSSDVTFTSGVDGTKKVSEVTPAEAQTLCENAEATAKDFADSVQGGLCKFSGALAGAFGSIGGGDAVAICEMAVTECENAETTVTASDCNAEAVAADCEATIEELEACYNDSLTATQEVFAEFEGKSCDELINSTSTDGPSIDVTTPASCTALATKCPSLNIGLPSTGTSTAT